MSKDIIIYPRSEEKLTVRETITFMLNKIRLSRTLLRVILKLTFSPFNLWHCRHSYLKIYSMLSINPATWFFNSLFMVEIVGKS